MFWCTGCMAMAGGMEQQLEGGRDGSPALMSRYISPHARVETYILVVVSSLDCS